MTSIQTHICFPPPLLRLSSSGHLAPSSWLLSKISSFRGVLRGSSMVRYPFCSLPCTLAKEVQLFHDLGVYSGIFAMYLQVQRQSDKSISRTASIVFYAICLLYLLSFVSDLVALIFEVSNNSICSKNFIYLYQSCSRELSLEYHR